MNKRLRGIVLTDSGYEKLEGAIATAQYNQKDGKRFTQAELSELSGLSTKTIRKIRDRTTPVDETSVRAFFQAFDLALETTDYGQPEDTNERIEPQTRLTPAKIDWGEKPDTAVFFGRTEELATLNQWVMEEQCRVVTLLGMGGIGKTSLAAKLADQIYEQFDYVIWRSLREAPPLDEILVRLIQFLSDQQETEINLPKRLGERIIRLLHYLREHRCLLVLDNLESILQAESAGQFRNGYEGYGELIHQIGAAEHQSCLLLTSRECPRELAPMAGDRLPVRLYSIAGINTDAGWEILKAKGLLLDETDERGQELIRRYSGNPQALHLVTTTIQREYLGDVDDFFEEEGAVVEDVWSLLDQHLARLAPLERSLLFWLAINREPVRLDELMEDLLPPVTKSEVREALGGLRDRSLIETVGKQFTLQNVIMEFATDRFFKQVFRELSTQKFDLFHTHTLIQATAKDYVRETQIRLILKPISDSTENLDQVVHNSLQALRRHPVWKTGYAAGNLMNLQSQLKLDIQSFDFSGLTLRQAYLSRANLYNWNLANSQWIKPVLKNPFGRISSVTFSPDGQWLAAGSEDAAVRLWQVSTGECRQTLMGHTDGICSVVFSSDGQRLVTGSRDATIRLWQVNTGKCYQTFTGHTSWVESVTLSPDGQWLVTCSRDTTVRLWQVSTGKCCRTFTQHPDWVMSAAFSPDGQWLATCSRDTTTRLWKVDTGECCQILTGHTDTIKTVSFSPDGQWLATGSRDTTIRLWKVDTGECCQILTGHTDGLRSACFSPDGNYLATGSADTTIRLWQARTGECCQVLTGHSNWVNAVRFSPDGQWLVSGSDDATIRLWQVNTGECRQVLTGHSSWVNAVAFSPDGEYLATGSEDTIIRLWKMSTGKCRQALTGHSNWVNAVAFSPDGQCLATGSDDATTRLWQVSTGECYQVLTGHSNWVNTVAFSPDGQCLATGSDDATTRLWQVSTGECYQVLPGHTDWVNVVTFSPDGQWLATGSEDATIRLWQASTGKCHKILNEHTEAVRAVAFSPDGHWLVTGSLDTAIRLWQLSTGECHKIMAGHTGAVRAVAFSPDGQWLATGGRDATIRLWQVSTGNCRYVLTCHNAWIMSLSFSPNGQLLAAGCGDAAIRLWQVSTGQYLKILRIPRPYEGANITGAQGLTEAQRASMLTLGAIDFHALMREPIFLEHKF